MDSEAWHSGHFARGTGSSDVPLCSFNIKGKGKGNVHPGTDHEGPEGE